MRFRAFKTLLAVFMAFGLLSGGLIASADQEQRTRPELQKPPQPQPQQPQKPQPNKRDDDDDGFKLESDLVMLDVTVVDPSNRPVMDLKKEDFTVLEDKVQQEVGFFSRDQVPVSVVLAIDTSGSMRAKLDTVIKASVNLVKESRPSDEIAVIEFKDQPELLEEFTTDINDVIDTLQSFVASRQTAMLDALYLGADYASKEGKNRRKAIVIVTDGLDKDSYYKFDEVVDHLREADVQVYLIGFTGDLEKGGSIFKKSEKEKADALLNKLADETGGKAFFPRELSEVHQISQQISNDLRTQYSIGYYPTNTKKDGTFRSVRVQVNSGSRKLIARTRTGYIATPQGAVSK